MELNITRGKLLFQIFVFLSVWSTLSYSVPRPRRGQRKDEGRRPVCVWGAGGEDHPDARSVAEREPRQGSAADGRRRRGRSLQRLLLHALNHTTRRQHTLTSTTQTPSLSLYLVLSWAVCPDGRPSPTKPFAQLVEMMLHSSVSVLMSQAFFFFLLFVYLLGPRSVSALISSCLFLLLGFFLVKITPKVEAKVGQASLISVSVWSEGTRVLSFQHAVFCPTSSLPEQPHPYRCWPDFSAVFDRDVLHPAPSSSSFSSSSQTLSTYRCWWRSFWKRSWGSEHASPAQLPRFYFSVRNADVLSVIDLDCNPWLRFWRARKSKEAGTAEWGQRLAQRDGWYQKRWQFVSRDLEVSKRHRRRKPVQSVLWLGSLNTLCLSAGIFSFPMGSVSWVGQEAFF